METQAFKKEKKEEEKPGKKGEEEKTLQEKIYKLGRKITDPKDTISQIPQTKQVQEAIKTDTTIKAIESTARLSERLHLKNIDIRGAVPNLLTAIEDIVPKRA